MSNNRCLWRNYWLVHVTSQYVFDKPVQTFHLLLLVVIEPVVKAFQFVILDTCTYVFVRLNNVEGLLMGYLCIGVACDDISWWRREFASSEVWRNAIRDRFNLGPIEKKFLQYSSNA